MSVSTLSNIAICSLLATGTVLIGGCVFASGSKAAANTEARAQIQNGKTTKQEVFALLGTPNGKSQCANGEEMWTYSYARTKARATNFIPLAGAFVGGADSQANSYFVTFGTNGMVSRTSEFDTLGGGGGLQDAGR